MKINLLDIPVFYINMKKDTDKRLHIEEQLSQVGFKNVTRIEAVEDKENGRVGLSKSQLRALSQVSAPFIVLEDDADPKHFEPVIEVPDSADAVYLGNSQWGLLQGHTGFYLKYKKLQDMPKIMRIYNMLSSHAILYLTNEYVSVCKRTTRYCAEDYALPMDVPYAMIQRFFNVYAINKPMFVQKDYENKMSAAPKYTNEKLTSYKRSESLEGSRGYLQKDDII